MIGTINQTFLSNGLALPFRKQFKMDKKAEKERVEREKNFGIS